MRKPWKHEISPEAHRDLAHVRRRIMDHKLGCPNCGGLVLIVLDDSVGGDLVWEQGLVKRLDGKAVNLMRIEEAEYLAQGLGVRPKEEGDE